MTIDEFRARSTGDDLLSGFGKWVRKHTSLHSMGDPVLTLRDFLENHGRSGFATDATALLPSSTAAALLRIQADCTAEDFDFLLHVLMGYTLYLDASDRWTGSDAAFDEVQSMLLEFVDEAADAAFDDRIFEVPALDCVQTLKALLELPMAKRMLAFMDWFGTTRNVTSKGLLTRKDIEGAAAALGVAAIGVASNPSQPDEPLDGPLRVLSAQDVNRLDLYWEALAELGVIAIGATKAELLNPLKDLEGEDLRQMQTLLLRDMALCIYARFCSPPVGTDELDDEDADASQVILSVILMDAGIHDGHPVDNLELLLEKSTGEDQIDLLFARLGLEALGREGLVEIENHYRIPRCSKRSLQDSSSSRPDSRSRTRTLPTRIRCTSGHRPNRPKLTARMRARAAAVSRGAHIVPVPIQVP